MKATETTPLNMLVTVLIDESGSMSSYRRHVIAAVNALIEGLTASSVPATVSVTHFGNYKVRKIIDKRPAFELPKLGERDYHSDGGTPLLRGLHETMKDMEDIAANKKVVIVISDGCDDGDGTHTPSSIRKRMDRLEATGDWLFLYVGLGTMTGMLGMVYGFAEGQMVCSPSGSDLATAMEAVGIAALSFQGDGMREIPIEDRARGGGFVSVQKYRDWLESQHDNAMDNYKAYNGVKPKPLATLAKA